MIEIDGSITVPQGINKFFEASWVHKRNGTYYYSYAAYNSSGKSWPSNIDYATSSNPLGPWTYKGTLNDYAGTGTNHSGIVQYNDLWYFVYHTDYLSGGTAWERSVQIDYLNYNTDGTIKKIVQTTAGLAPLGNTPFLSNEFYKIRARHSGKLMSVAGASKANEGNVEQSSDDGNYCQQWRFIEIERGVYEIVNRNSGLALDANLSNNNVLQYEYLGTANQKWKVTGAGNGSFYIVNKANNRMLEVYYAEMTDRSNIQHWGFNGETCQQWDLVRNDSTTTQINNIEIDNNQFRFLKEIKATTYFSTRSDIASDASEMFDLTGRILGNKTVTIKKSSGLFIRNTNR
jgi:hypothetical protein